MIQLTTRIRENRLNKKGETRVLIVLYKGKISREVSSGVGVKPENWKKNGRVSSKDDFYLTKNSAITKELGKLDALIRQESALNPDVSVKRIIELYKGKSEQQDPLFTEYLEDYISRNPQGLRFGTLTYYNTCLERIKEFDEDVRLNQINVDFLERFENYLKIEFINSPNTIFNRMKVIRKVLRIARREGKIKHYPFEHYKIKTEKTKREYLSLDELKKLSALKGLPPSYELVKDIFLFSVYAGGLRFGDMCTLNNEHIVERNGHYRLERKMGKTEDYLSFKLNNQALEIIDKYKDQGVGEYVFPILHEEVETNTIKERKLISRRNAYFNKVIKELAKKAKIKKHLTMHTARHTHATIALSLGVQTEVIGDIMGHKDLKTTQIYTKILDERKDEAIDKWNSLK